MTTNFNYIGRLSAVAWQGNIAGLPTRWTVGTDKFISNDTTLSLASDFGFTGSAFTGKRDGVGADSQIKLGGFDLWGEYLRVQFRPTNSVPASSFESNAWYLQATYFVVPSIVQAVVKFETFDPNDKKATNETDTWTVGANWFLKGDDLKLQAAYLYTTLPTPSPIQRQLVLRVQTIF